MALRIASGERRLNLQNCFDLRDLGGYQTTDGGIIRWRRLYRSDGLYRLSLADQTQVAELGLSTVLDLRTPQEVAEQGCSRVPATLHQVPMADVLPSLPGTQAPSAEAACISESYFSTLTASFETVQEILAVLTDPTSYPAVVSCASGVDRTGIVTGVVLALLGVPDGVVVRDYAASREAALRRIGRLRFEHPRAVCRDLDRYGPGLLGVVPEAMARFLERVRTEHGSFAGYAESIDMAGAVPYLRAALVQERA